MGKYTKRKSMKLLLTVVMVICITVMQCAVTANAALSSFNADVKNGVCVVAEYIGSSSGQEQLYAWGTGFFVGEDGENPQYLITNHHVVEDYLELGKGQYYNHATLGNIRLGIRVYYGQNDYCEAFVVDYDETKDIAVVQLDNSTDQRKPLTLRVPTEEMQGSTIYVVGFPGISDNLALEAISKWGKDDVSVTTGALSRLLTVTNRGGTKAIQTDADINHGNSGGPMVDVTGSVIGINSWGYSDGGGGSVQYAVNIEEAIKLLDRNNIRYTLYTDESPSGVIRAGVIIGIVAAVIVAAAVVVILVMNNKKKGQKTSQTQSAKTSAKKAVIRSMSVQHAGKAFPVGKAPVIIGRNAAECVIVFKEGTPGVSGKHCSIYYNSDTGAFTLTDLNSSFGTFLSNGMKLTANSPINLKPGDSFYVGDKTNVIKVEVEQ